MHRRQVGFSQDEIAFLLGAMSGSKTCRYERRSRLPPLKTALALEIIFQASARELFPGVFREAEIAVKERASGLMRSLMRREETKVNARKVEGLQTLRRGVSVSRSWKDRTA
jgi:transcriptional regulator with XRE-family HTH domain